MKASTFVLCFSALVGTVLAEGKCCCKPPTTVTKLITVQPETVTVTYCPEKATQAPACTGDECQHPTTSPVCTGDNCKKQPTQAPACTGDNCQPQPTTSPVCTDSNQCHPPASTSEVGSTTTTFITNTVTVYPTQAVVTSPCPTCKVQYSNSTVVPTQAPVTTPSGKYLNTTVAVVKKTYTSVVTETQVVPCTDDAGAPSSSHVVVTRTTTVCPEEETGN